MSVNSNAQGAKRMSGDHALLSASSAHRWIKCPPSARREAHQADQITSYAEEGTLAHAIAELTLRTGRELDATDLAPYETSPYFSLEMLDHAQGYAEFVRSLRRDGDRMVIEQRVDYDAYAPEGFGTCDCALVSESHLTIIDYKYGKGVRVSAEDNPQLKLYGLGLLQAYSVPSSLVKVTLCIYQPRLDHVDLWETDSYRLRLWGESIKDVARQAWAGEGEGCAGDHCTFCRCRGCCPELAAYCLQDFDREGEGEEMKDIKLTPHDYSRILGKLPLVRKWMEAVEAQALELMMTDPDAISGYKVVEGRSLRRYSDQAGFAQALLSAGYEPAEIYKPQELLSLTDMSRLMGKAKFEALVAPYVTKPRGKPTIAPMSDKRPQWSGAEDFENEN